MTVEWGRSCYAGGWRLFRDDTSLITRGRYYFSRPESPHFDGMHHLGSRNWHDANWITDQGLGEDLVAPHKWNAGQPPAAPPLPIQVGRLQDLADGALSSEAIPEIDAIDGYPSDCYGQVELLPLWRKASSYARCCTQRFYSTVIGLLYEDKEAEILDLIADWLGPTVTVKIHKAYRDLPAIITMVSPEWSGAVLDGTRLYQTIAVQAFESFSAPINFGIYSTLPLWYQAGQYLMATLAADGASPTAPVFLCGHSYGGVAALLAAASYRSASPHRYIRYLTFGCPKPGDIRLKAILESCAGYDICNYGDIVTILPPDLRILTPISTIIGVVLLSHFPLWIRPPHQMLQLEDGHLAPRIDTIVDTTLILYVVQHAIDGHPMASITAHKIPEYIRRVRLHCPITEWPINQEVNDDLDEYRPLAGGAIVLGTGLQRPAEGAIVLGTSPQPIGDGAIVLTGHGQPSLPSGSIHMDWSPPTIDDCTYATTISLGMTYQLYDILAPNWLKLPVSNGVAYSLQYHWISRTTLGYVVLYKGVDCAHLTFFSFWAADSDFSLTRHADNDPYWFLEFVGGTGIEVPRCSLLIT